MKSVITVLGPRGAGPGEREQMLDRAAAAFRQLDVTEYTRVDVPGRGAGDDTDDAGLRGEVQRIVPALQSGSLFGGRTGVLVVDAHQLQRREAEVLAELVKVADPDAVVAVFVAESSVPAPLGKTLRSTGDTLQVAKLKERDVGEWLGHQARARDLKIEEEAAAELIHRFGSDVAAIGLALDQLGVEHREITGELVRGRFKNRPDEPMWYYGDAVAAGDQGEALRRLEDFLEHGHPLQLLAFLDNDVRKRALAAVAPDYETYAEWIGASPDSWPAKKVWRQRAQVKASDLHLALDALARADLTLKTSPEETHRVTLERLTVALCRWYGGARLRTPAR